MADPEFDVPGAIDMLIGNDLYPLVLLTKTDVIHSPGLPSAMSTLGWVIGGALNKSTESSVVSLSNRVSPSIEGLLRQFWAVEEPPIPDKPTTEDELVDNDFRKQSLVIQQEDFVYRFRSVHESVNRLGQLVLVHRKLWL